MTQVWNMRKIPYKMLIDDIRKLLNHTFAWANEGFCICFAYLMLRVLFSSSGGLVVPSVISIINTRQMWPVYMNEM